MIDAPTFRAVLGRLASGVSIVTTVGPGRTADHGPDRGDYGMTVTSVCSLSLHPPLILVCVDHDATMHPHLMTASHFALSILTREQEAVARRFAESTDGKFSGVDTVRGTGGCALIDGALAHLECAMWAQYEGGDHTIFVGQVVRTATRDAEALLYYRSGYLGIAR